MKVSGSVLAVNTDFYEYAKMLKEIINSEETFEGDRLDYHRGIISAMEYHGILNSTHKVII